MAHITSLVIEKVKFNHSLIIISPWELSVAMATKPRGRPPNILLLGIVLRQATSVQNYSYCFFNGSGGAVIQKIPFFFNLMLPWQANKIVTGHQTHKLGRQPSNDHNCQIWFTPLHWLWRKCNLTIFPL